MQGGVGRCGEVRGGAGRCGEMQGDAGRSEEIQGDAGRCREVQGGAGRCGETYRWVLSSTCLHQQGIYSNSAMATDSHRPCNMLQHFIKRQLRNRQNKLVPLL